MYTSILPILLLISTSDALALLSRDDPGPGVWKAPEAGNLRIRFSDAKVNIAGCHAADIIDTLNEHCKDGAGVCEPGPWTIECASDGDPYHIEVTTSDSQHDAKLKKGLIEALKAAIETDKVSESREVIGAKGGGCTGCPCVDLIHPGHCDEGLTQPRFTPTKSTFYNMPSTISISHKVDWNADGPPDVIAFTVANPGDDGGKGFCEVVTGIGAAIAGAVNGAAGSVFKLGHIACDLI